jgi:IclR family acetate operon transcriptional repressor
MQSTLTALRVLEVVGERQPIAVADVARAIDRPKSTAQRALLTLHEAGWIRPDGTERTRWVLSGKVLGLARLVANDAGLRAIARPWLEHLRNETGESVTLAVRDGLDTVTAEFLEGRHSIRFVSPVGRRLPLHAGAFGRVILAHLPMDVREQVISGPLASFTPRTITGRRALVSDLARIRRKGYAVSLGEVTEGAAGVAGPVLGANGWAVASVAVAGPLQRLSRPADVERVAGSVRQAAEAISVELGGLPAPDDPAALLPW